MIYKAKLNENYTHILHCISSFEGTSYEYEEKLKIQLPVPLFVVLYQLWFFISPADIIFYNILELHLKLSGKDFYHKFSFFREHRQKNFIMLSR